MALMVVVSILLAAFAWRLQRARRQAEAVRVLRALDDCVAYESQWSMDRGIFQFDPGRDSSIPAFFLTWLGTDFFHDADQVRQIRRQPRSQAEIEQFWNAVVRLPALESLDVEGSWMYDRGFAGLRGSRHLRRVFLRDALITNEELTTVGSMMRLEAFHAAHWPPSSSDPILPIDDQGIVQLKGLSSLREFSLSHSRATPGGMRALVEDHPKLVELQLRGPSLTDEVAAAAKDLPNLVRLGFYDSEISDQGLAYLAQLPNLDSLTVEGEGITDQGLSHLRQMHNLGALGIRKTSLRGSGLKHLCEMPSLGSLWLEHNPLTDDGLKYVEDFSRLSVLDLGDTEITDTGIIEFKLPPKLQVLQLYDTQITDRALEALAKHGQLTMLDVRRTKVTDAGVAAFKNARPKCRLQH